MAIQGFTSAEADGFARILAEQTQSKIAASKARGIDRLLRFETGSIASKWTWKQIGFRAPKKGEYFVSGAVPEAYLAYNDMTDKYLIVERLAEHKLKQVWMPV